MRMKQIALWLSCLSLGILVLAGCAPRAGEGATASAASGQDLLIDLPALVIDFAADGKATLAGVPLRELSPDLASLDTLIGPDTIGTFTENGIQHLQISLTPTGLDLLVNGQALPSVGWDGESLASAQQLLGLLGDDGLALVERILPQIANLGVGVTLRFPPSQGAELIPLTVVAEGTAAESAAQAQAAYLAEAGSPAKINLPITYASDGSFRIGSLTAEQLTLLVGAPIESLTLTAEDITRYTELGLQTITLATNADGVALTLNGQPLPHLSWGDGKLAYGLNLALQSGLIGGGDGDSTALGALVEKLLPMIQTSEINVQITFPQ
ncbi:MAG: hypothetical protein KF832_14560 [Caldilineaceae bacterium]|nr:hypothetical protein [Caldilineaceae bacterium]